MRIARSLKWLGIVLVLAFAGMVFLRPAACRPHNPHKKVFRSQCMGNLRTLGQLAILYADGHQHNLAVAEGESPRAHASLQILVDALPEACEPERFVCPGSKETPPLAGSDGRLQLTEKNVSYAWRAKPLKMTGTGGSKVVLGCEKTLENHDGTGVNVLYIDGAVKWLTKQELGEGGLEGFLARHELTR